LNVDNAFARRRPVSAVTNHSPTRRDALRVGCVAVATSVAGCLGAFGTDDDDGNAGRRLRLSLSHSGGSLRERHVIDPAETRSAADGPAFRAAVEGATYTTQHRKPFFSTADDPEYAEHDGTYYRLGSVVVDEAVETRPVLRLRETDSDDTDAVAVEGLPEGDRAAVRVAQMAARARDDEGGVPWGLVQRGGYVYRSAAAVDASRLLADDGPDAVAYRGTEYRVDVDRERFHEPVYRATVEPVANDPEGMETVLRAALVDARIDRGALSDAAREVLRTARGEGYGERHPYSSGYRAVLRSLHERAYLDGDVEKDAFGDGDHGAGTLLYGGEYYDYRLRFGPTS
jgi:hypothetical protein